MMSTAPAAPSRPASAPRTRPARRKPFRLIAACVWLAVLGAGVQAALGFFVVDDLSPVGNAHLTLLYLAFMSQVFLFHMGVAMGMCAAFALATRRWLLALLAWCLAIAGAGPELSPFLRSPPAAPSTAAGQPRVTILSANLLVGAADHDAIIAAAESSGADVLVFQEWTVACGMKLGPRLRHRWPHSTETASDDAFGEAVFSRFPIAGAPGFILGESRRPQIATTFDVDGRRVRIANIHIFPPGSRSHFRQQRAQAKAIADVALAPPPPGEEPIAALVGDFNATRRTGMLRPFLDAGWVDAHAAAGSGRCSTWPSIGRFRHLPGIRLDNTVVSPGWRVVEAKVLDANGSDHRPTIVTIERIADVPAGVP